MENINLETKLTITVGQLLALLGCNSKAERVVEEKAEVDDCGYAVGLKGIQEFMNCSLRQAQYLAEGKLKPAVKQKEKGSRIYLDKAKAREILAEEVKQAVSEI